MSKLLAKSEPQTTLKEHIDDGLRIWKHLKHAFPKSTALTSDNFWDLLRTAIIFHDLGKGHSQFQEVLKGNKNNQWNKQRHELFSLPFVSALPLDKKEKVLLERVVTGHHKTFSELNENYISGNYTKDSSDYEDEFSLVDKEAVLKILESYGGFNLTEIQLNNPGKVIRKYNGEVEDGEIQNYLMTLLLFGAFKHCDHMASAYIGELKHLENSSFDFLDKIRIELQSKEFDFYDHQVSASQKLGNIILTAPTGSGKTETSLLWLRNQMDKTGQGRVFYTLPFTASINAMFKRLENEKDGFGKEKVGMLHGKLTAFLYDYFQDESSISKRKDEITTIKNQFKTLETPFKVLTPFQLLKHIFGLKGFEKGIFEWTGGYFIFDEIHAYDASVFAQIKILLQFLTQKMGASVFIMTATLPSFIKEHLKEAIGDFEEIQAFKKLYESFDRHQVVLKEGLLKDNINLIKSDLEKGEKILIVCNTVEQAQDVFYELSDYPSILIHGAFNGKDRNDKEKKLSEKEPQLLIGTQAIEVSLDIDYEKIYTEPAPLDALIQRFGRVNRQRKKEICECIVFKERNEKDEYIYKQPLIDRTIQVLQEIISSNLGIIKEQELQIFIDQVYPCFDEKSQEEFNSTYSALNNSIQFNLIPFEHSADREEDFYSQFDGIKVLPASLENEYKSFLRNFDFIGAELLKVQIRKNWFRKWNSEGDLEKDTFILPHHMHNGRPIEIDYYVLKKKYNEHLGLRKNEDDSRIYNLEI